MSDERNTITKLLVLQQDNGELQEDLIVDTAEDQPPNEVEPGQGDRDLQPTAPESTTNRQRSGRIVSSHPMIDTSANPNNRSPQSVGQEVSHLEQGRREARSTDS